MAHFVRDLDQHEILNYMPLDDMHRKQRVEVYEAAGDRILALLERDSFIQRRSFDFLMKLDDGRLVAFLSNLTHEANEVN